SNVVGQALPGKPADEAGIRQGDRIVEINGRKVETWEQITNSIHKNPGKEVQLTVVRNGAGKKIEVTPVYDEKNKIGLIGMHPSTNRPGFIGAVKLGTVQTYQTLALTLDFLGKMFTKEVPLGELGGPVRITSELGKAAEMGPFYLLSFAGFLNIQIGLFNLLPIPALDGSRIVFLAFEGLRGRPVDPTKENFIHLVGLGLLLLLIVVITYRDIVQILS
ncbi:RIP metalloprotease RseP, partial [bacterium]